MQRNLDQAKINISIAPSEFDLFHLSAIAMASQATKLCRVCMVFVIALMASDSSFASHKVAKPATLQKWEDRVTQAGFAVIFSAVFGLLWFYRKFKPLRRSHFSFFRARKPIVSGFNRSEGCGNFFLMKAPPCSRITSARQSFPSWRSLTLENATLRRLRARLLRRPKKMLQLQQCEL